MVSAPIKTRSDELQGISKYCASYITIFGVFLSLSLAVFSSSIKADYSITPGCEYTISNAGADCLTVTPPASDVITINSEFLGTDWVNAQIKEMTGSAIGRVRFLRRNDDALFFYITVLDESLDASDRLEIRIDTAHSHGSDHLFFVINRNANAHSRTVVGGGSIALPWNQSLVIDSCNSGACTLREFPGQGFGWAVRLELSAADLGLVSLNALSSVMGFSISAVTSEGAAGTTSAQWPNPFVAQSAWAHLKTRYPVKYGIVLDQSGSMLSENKWQNAVQAANFLTNTMAILSDQSYFLDSVSLVTYAWLNSSTEPAVVYPLPALGSVPSGDYLAGVSFPINANLTPIGKGLDLGFSNLGTGDVESRRVLLLLSDGLHNRPTADVPLAPAHLDYTPCGSPMVWDADDTTPGNQACNASTVTVNTVAFGEPGSGSVDEELLSNIKNYFGGVSPDSAYNMSSDGEVLKEHFISSLQGLYQFNQITAAMGADFMLEDKENRLIVILSKQSGSPPPFKFQHKASPSATWSSTDPVVECDRAAVYATVGFSFCIKNNPAGGTWRLVDDAGAPLSGPFSDSQTVLVDLSLRAKFSIEQQSHGTGQDIFLTANLNELGKPITNTTQHAVKVNVSINRPIEGMGTLLSTRTEKRCKPQAPTLPRLNDKFFPPVLSTMRLSTTKPVSFRTANVSKPEQTSTRAQRILANCNKTRVDYNDDDRYELFDDGSHGDVVADDGIYSLRFNNTRYDGTYIFNFNAMGVAPSGGQFSRRFTRAEFVRVEVDPETVVTESRTVKLLGNKVIKEFHVTPRDSRQAYLGPGHSNDIKFVTTAGNFIGGIRDYNNGIYSRLLQYDESRDKPWVKVQIQGNNLPAVKAFKNYEYSLVYGTYSYDAALNIGDADVIGLKLGYRYNNRISSNLEYSNSRSSNSNGESKINQLLINLRYDFPTHRLRQHNLFVTAGAGTAFLRTAIGSGDTTIFHTGVGVWRDINDCFALRATVRMFYFDDVLNIGKTRHQQTTLEAVYKF